MKLIRLWLPLSVIAIGALVLGCRGEAEKRADQATKQAAQPGQMTDDALKAAAARVRAEHPDGGEKMWLALAKLVEPGMTVRQMVIVLPPLVIPDDGTLLIGGQRIEVPQKPGPVPRLTLWNGQSFYMTYPLDGNFGVAASGVSKGEGDDKMVLTSRPSIKPHKELWRTTTAPAASQPGAGG